MHGRPLDHLKVVTCVLALVLAAFALLLVVPGAGSADPSGPPTPLPSGTDGPTESPTESPSGSPSESPSLGPAPSIGPAVQAKRTVERTCRAVITRYYESTDGGPFELVGVRRVPTGRLCRPQVAGPTAPPAPVPTAVAGGV